MNNPHQNARTTIHSRELIVERHRQGRPVAVIAGELGISTRTVYKWLRRFRQDGRGALANAPSAPARCPPPCRLARHRIALVLYLRRTYRLTAAAIAGKLGLARATAPAN